MYPVQTSNRALGQTLAAASLAALLASVPDQARSQNEPLEAADEIEEIVVTGSRIKRRDFVSASPIATVDSSLFEQSGSATVETMLNTLPQFVPGYTQYTNNRGGPSFVNAPGTGQAIMDLRGIGIGRTLVLLDGRRVVPSNPYGSVDVNLIPPAIIESVEIITGGASAVYGTDAIAGVVNFKTRKFAGLEVDAGWQQTERGDGSGWNLGLTAGIDSSRGYAFGHFGYSERDSVWQADRKFSEISAEYDTDSGEFVPSGSGVIRQGRWDQLFFNLPTQDAIDGFFAGVDPAYAPGAVSQFSPIGFNPDGSPFSVAPVHNFTGDTNEPLQPVNLDFYAYNFGPVNYLRTPMERSNFFGQTGLYLGDTTNLFLQVLWADYSPAIQLAPTPLFFTYVGANNPFIHADVATLLASRPDPTGPFAFRKRMTDIGPRIASVDYGVVQVLVGIDGELGLFDDWSYEAYASWGDVDSSNGQLGNVSRSAFEELSLAPDAGASICGGQGMNPFGINSISEECAAYFTRSSFESTSVTQIVIEANIDGPVFEMPAGDARAVFGLFYKEDDFDFRPDLSLSATRVDPVFGVELRDIVGFNPADPISGKVDSVEVFMEANVPLLADARFARSLELAVGYRYSDHSNSGSIDAYKAEGIWRVTGPVMLRASYQHAVRAPDFIALFEPQTIALQDIFGDGEPCESDFVDEGGEILGAQDDPDVAALCIAQGIPADVLPTYIDADKAIEVIVGGNPAVEEEVADTYTYGIVVESPGDGWASGLTVSLDYYKIEMSDVIGQLFEPEYDCYNRRFNPTLDPNNFFCRRLQRDPLTHELTDVLKTTTNIAIVETSGYDLQLEYGMDAGPGQLRLQGVASYLESAKQADAPGSDAFNFRGKANFSELFTLAPKWKLMASASYLVGSFDGTLRWRYIDGMEDVFVPEFVLPSRQYFDLTLGYEIGSGALEGLGVRGGVTNLTDRDPVVYPSWIEANTDPSTYDVLGRRFFVRATYTF